MDITGSKSYLQKDTRKRSPVLMSVAISVLLEIKKKEGYLIFETSVQDISAARGATVIK